MPSSDTPLRTAAVQFRATESVTSNVDHIIQRLALLARDGVRVAAFPECAVTSYDDKVIVRTTERELADAEQRLSDACREHGIYAVVGMPYFAGGKRYNGAVVWNPEGDCIARYGKIQLIGETWFTPGGQLVVFPVDGILCSVIICFDARFPELVRIPVLAGAQVVFYLSCETDSTAERSMEQYRAQVIARAVENTVWVVCANTPMGEVWLENGKPCTWGRNANGRSRIVRPDGGVVDEATMWAEDAVTADIDPNAATRYLAELSRQSPMFRDWWESGLTLLGPSAPPTS